MRSYGKVYCRFWDSEDIRALSDDGRMLALYLMTCAHGTLAGIMHLPNGYVCEDMQWSSERVSKGFDELLRKGFATRCERSKWVWITKYLEWNEPENGNQCKAVAKILNQVPDSCHWRSDFQEVFNDLTASFSKRLANRSRTVSNPGSGTVTVSGSGTGSGTGTGYIPHAPRADATGAAPGGECAGGAGSHAQANGNGHDPEQPEGFEQIRAVYPARSGTQRWADAMDRYVENLKAGYSHEQMLAGVTRYAQYCVIEQITGQKHVQQAATFLGDNRGFMEPWTPSAAPPPEAGDRWIREQEAKAKNAKH